MELPRLQELHEQFRDQGFEVVAVETNQEADLATAFIKKNNLSFTFLQDIEGEGSVGAGTFGVVDYPTTYLIDREGRVMYFHNSFDPGDEKMLADEITSLL